MPLRECLYGHPQVLDWIRAEPKPGHAAGHEPPSPRTGPAARIHRQLLAGLARQSQPAHRSQTGPGFPDGGEDVAGLVEW